MVGLAAHPCRDSDMVESVRHKLGELTDLHGLKRSVLVWSQWLARKEGLENAYLPAGFQKLPLGGRVVGLCHPSLP